MVTISLGLLPLLYWNHNDVEKSFDTLWFVVLVMCWISFLITVSSTSFSYCFQWLFPLHPLHGPSTKNERTFVFQYTSPFSFTSTIFLFLSQRLVFNSYYLRALLRTPPSFLKLLFLYTGTPLRIFYTKDPDSFIFFPFQLFYLLVNQVVSGTLC